MAFITGGTGLVGSRLIFDLVKSGEKVVALKRKETSSEKAEKIWACYTDDVAGIAENVTWIDGDLLDLDTLERFLQPNSDIYHCAAQVSFNPKDNEKIKEVNVQGTANLVNVSLQKGVRKFCHVSSIGAIGSKVNGSIVTEETPWLDAGKSNYSLSKYYAEMEVWRGMAEGLNAVIVNPAVILGAGNWLQGSPELFSRVAKGMKYATLGSTSYVSVEDVTKAMICLMNAEVSDQRFILAERTLTYKALFEHISKALNINTNFKTASVKLTGLVWRFEKLNSLVRGKLPRLTKHTHRIAHKEDAYSGDKIKQFVDFEYTDLLQSINDIAAVYKEQHQ